MQYVRQQILEFTSTNLTDIYADWNSTATYIVEPDNALTNASVVRYGTYYYRSLTATNLNYNPETYENIKWIKIGVSNKYAMLDLSANSKSIKQGGDLVVVFPQNYHYTLGLGNYDASSVLVEILASDLTTVIWATESVASTNLDVYDYYSYIYEPYTVDHNFSTKIELPKTGAYIRVTFKRLASLDLSSCGYLVLGTAMDMGKSLLPVKFNYNSFADKTVSDLGKLIINKSWVQDLVDFETVIASTTLSRMRRELKSIYDEVLLFIVDEREDSLFGNVMTLGVIQDASVIMENHIESVVSFSVMEAL